MAKLAERVVSLVPSLTEAICDLGAAERLAGITDYCPPVRPGLARVGGPRTLQLEAIRALAPDLVVACIEENPREDLEWLGRHAEVFAPSCRSLDDAAGLVRGLGTRLSASPQAAEHLARLEVARAEVGGGVLRPRRLFYPVWKHPWMAVGTGCFPAAMLGEAGGISVLHASGRAYPTLEIEELVRLAPELILLPDEPWHFGAGDARELERLFSGPAPPIIGVPGRWAAWYGTRMDQGLRGLAAAISS